MFDQFRYNLKHNRKSVVKNVTAWLIFGAIILVFVFWGMTPRNQSVAAGGAAATVNDANISLLEFNDAMERMRRDPRFEQLQSLGADAGRQILQQQALNQLIEGEVLHQATDDARIWTTDAEVRSILMGVPAFQENGRFSATLYHDYLTNNRKNASEVEDEIRREQSVRLTVTLFNAALKPLKLETDRQAELAKMRAEIEYVALPTDNLVLPETISAADEKTFVATAGNSAKIKDYFDSHKQEFSQPDRVKVRHILIRAKAGDADSERKALAKIEELAKRAKTEDFAKLASDNSEDPGSKAKGGLIDYFAKGKMVPQFEEAAFSTPVNSISAPVKTDYGYHLIQVLDKKPATSRTLEEVQDDIAGTLIAKDRSRTAVEALDESLKKGDTKAVMAFVADHKLKWEDTGPFSIETENIPKIGPNEELMRTAFELTPEKPLAPSLVREGTRALIVRYKAAPPVKAEDMKGKEDMMLEMAANRRSEDALRKWIDGLRKSARISTNAQVFGKGAPQSDTD